MKILFYTQLWKRPELTELVFKQITSIKREGYEFVHLAVLSEEEMIPLCEKYGIKYVWADNLPLGKKHNIGLDAAMKLDWDYMINYGSDDLVSDKLLNLYESHLKKGVDFFGLNDIFFYDGFYKKLLSYSYNKIGQAVFGAGRVTSRRMLDRIKGQNKRIEFWADNANKGLDGSSRDIARRHGYNNVSIRTKEPFIVDVKTDTNISYIGNYQATEKDIKVLDGYFSSEIIHEMQEIEVLQPKPRKMEQEERNVKIYVHRKNSYASYKRKLKNPDGSPMMIGSGDNKERAWERVEFKDGFDGGSPDYSGTRQVAPGRLATNDAALQDWIEKESGLFNKEIFLHKEVIPQKEVSKPKPVKEIDSMQAKIEALKAGTFKKESNEDVLNEGETEDNVEDVSQIESDAIVVGEEVSSVSAAKAWLKSNASRYGFEVSVGDIRNRDAIKLFASKHNIQFTKI